MKFDDEEMAFWKSISDGDDETPNLEIHPMTLRAIFDRMEAAEAVIEWSQPTCFDLLQAWRKVAGK